MADRDMRNFVRVRRRRRHEWRISREFTRIEAWRNVARVRDREKRFLLRLGVGPVDEARYLIGRAGRLLGPREPKVEEFTFDTGAEVTLITRPLALELGLDEGPIVRLLLPKGSMNVRLSKIRLDIGDAWLDVPCVVPIRARADHQNLLGMEGLFGRHMFCVARNELHLFRDQSLHKRRMRSDLRK